MSQSFALEYILMGSYLIGNILLLFQIVKHGQKHPNKSKAEKINQLLHELCFLDSLSDNIFR